MFEEVPWRGPKGEAEVQHRSVQDVVALFWLDSLSFLAIFVSCSVSCARNGQSGGIGSEYLF